MNFNQKDLFSGVCIFAYCVDRFGLACLAGTLLCEFDYPREDESDDEGEENDGEDDDDGDDDEDGATKTFS